MTLMRYTPLFPFDPSIDSAMEHQHLVLAYVVVLAVQIFYLGYLVRQFVVARRAHSAMRRDARR
jgi:hypothetical protein